MWKNQAGLKCKHTTLIARKNRTKGFRGCNNIVATCNTHLIHYLRLKKYKPWLSRTYSPSVWALADGMFGKPHLIQRMPFWSKVFLTLFWEIYISLEKKLRSNWVTLQKAQNILVLEGSWHFKCVVHCILLLRNFKHFLVIWAKPTEIPFVVDKDYLKVKCKTTKRR